MDAPRQTRFFARVLGGFEISLGDEAVIDRSWSRRKAQTLIKLLTLSDGHALHREEVLEQLWPDLERSAALNNLHKNLHYVRATCLAQRAADSVVLLRGEMVELAPGTEVDADQFRATAQAALRTESIEQYQQAAELYRGDLLPEDIYEEWTEPVREELRTLYGDLLLKLAQLHEARQEIQASTEVLQRLLRAEPANEEANLHLMRLFAQLGSRHRALRQFQILRDVLASELDAEPSPEIVRLYEDLLRGGDTRAPAAPAAAEQAADPPGEGIDLPGPAPPPVYGREREMEQAEHALAAMLRGRGGALFVQGEAGIGKSHLVEHLLAAARESACRVHTAACAQLESSAAYQPFRDILQQAIADPEIRDLARRSFYLHLLVFGVDEGHEPRSRDPQSFQAELFAEVHGLVEAIAKRQPLVIVIDDLHAADEDSLRMLHYLARRVSAQRVLLLATYRHEDLEQASTLLELLASLRRDQLLDQIDLQPLAEAPMTLLVERLFDPGPVAAGLVREVIDQAEGNPLFAGELVRTLVREGWAQRINGAWQRRGTGAFPVPAAVTDLLAIRFQRLSPAAQEELHIAAALGRNFDYPILQRTLGLPEGQALDALDECIEASIIEEARDRYRFRHDLLREAIYGRLTTARRRTLHKRLAQGLEAAFAHPVESTAVEAIGHHYERSDEPWRALPYLIESGRRAALVFANERAVDLYQRALSLAGAYPDLLEAPGMAALLEALGDLERRRGNLERSVELFEQAKARFAEAGSVEAAIRVRGKTALAYIVLERVDLASDIIGSMREDLSEESPADVVARTHYLLAQLHWHSGENEDALEAAERSLTAASASGDPAERAQACEVLALACHSLGNWQRGIQLELERQSLGVPGLTIDEAFDAHL